MSQPTQQTYGELERAFDFFNEHLFESRLPRCLITLQRQHETYGYFSRDRFMARDGSGERTHEIALNPCYFAVHPIQMTLSVLVREMVSLDQVVNGEPGRRRYRNKQWADMLEVIGLMPTDTGQPGGRRVGENVNHYIIEGGIFDQVCGKLVDDQFSLSWVDRFPPMMASDNAEAVPDGEHLPPPAALQDAAENADVAASVMGADEGDGFAAEGLAGGDAPWLSSAAPEPGSLDIEHDSGPEAGSADQGQAPLEPVAGKPAPPPMKRMEIVGAGELKEQGFEIRDQVKKQNREKYVCPSCQVKAWAKPGLRLGCYNCSERPEMVPSGVA